MLALLKLPFYPFWNFTQRRPRAAWRLAINFALIALFYLKGGNLVLGWLFECYPQLQQLGQARIMLLGMAVFHVAVMAACIGCTWLLDRRPFFARAWRERRLWCQDLICGLILGAVLMAGIFFGCLYSGNIRVTAYCQVAETTMSFWQTMGVYALLFIMVGIHEESFSRGYQLTNFAQGLSFMPKWLAVGLACLLSSAVFGAMHLANPGATTISTVNIAIAGITLALPYIITGRLGVSIGMHITWNFFQTCVFGFACSGLRAHATIYQIEQLDSGWLTGGPFGPEAGVAGLLAMLASIPILLIWSRCQRKDVLCIEPRVYQYEAR